MQVESVHKSGAELAGDSIRQVGKYFKAEQETTSKSKETSVLLLRRNYHQHKTTPRQSLQGYPKPMLKMPKDRSPPSSLQICSSKPDE
jgi:hypothetical protein